MKRGVRRGRSDSLGPHIASGTVTLHNCIAGWAADGRVDEGRWHGTKHWTESPSLDHPRLAQLGKSLFPHIGEKVGNRMELVVFLKLNFMIL